jgi:hypothetical protein
MLIQQRHGDREQTVAERRKAFDVAGGDLFVCDRHGPNLGSGTTARKRRRERFATLSPAIRCRLDIGLFNGVVCGYNGIRSI